MKFVRVRRPSLVVLAAAVIYLPVVVLAAPSTVTSGHPVAPPSSPMKERRLHLATAEASSYLINDWNRFQENYLPLYVGDDDPRTTWNLKTEGIGEWIRLRVTPMERATRVRMKVRNGYQKSERLFQANSRARVLTVVLLPSNHTQDVELTDAYGWQEIAVEQPAGALEAVELRVKSVYPGKKYDDLCLSDVQLFVTAGSSDNPAFEKQHFDKVIAWKKDRAAAAKLFRTELAKSLPITAQYLTSNLPERHVARNPAKACAGLGHRDSIGCWMAEAAKAALEAVPSNNPHAQALETAVALAGADFATMTPVRVSSRDTRAVPTVDGVCTPPFRECFEDPCGDALNLPLTGQIGYLQADALALVEQTGLPSAADVLQSKAPQCKRREAATYTFAARNPAATTDGVGPLKALLVIRCGLVEGREGPFPFSLPQLLVYGDQGRLEVVADRSRATTLDWKIVAGSSKLAGGSRWTSDGYGLNVASADPMASR